MEIQQHIPAGAARGGVTVDEVQGCEGEGAACVKFDGLMAETVGFTE